MIQRRGFLIGLASMLAAPAIVHAGNLMPIKARPLSIMAYVNPLYSDDEGLPNTFKTIQAAYNYIEGLDLNGGHATIQLGPGVYESTWNSARLRGTVTLCGEDRLR